MNRSRPFSLALLAVLAPVFAGCAINQTVKPVERVVTDQICVVDNPRVSQAGFGDAYRRALAAKGFKVRPVPAGSGPDACPLTATYTANFRWDMALYLAFAELSVFSDGEPSGKATYDAMQGGANMNKFIKAEQKVNELVEQLFPGTATSLRK